MVHPAPTPVAMLIGTAIIAAVSGYMIGIASSLGFLPIPFMPKPARERGVANYDDETESEEEDIDESILDHAPNWANGVEADRRDGLSATAAGRKKDGGRVKQEWEAETMEEECKMVLVVRTDLGMTKGNPSTVQYFPFRRYESNNLQAKSQHNAGMPR